MVRLMKALKALLAVCLVAGCSSGNDPAPPQAVADVNWFSYGGDHSEQHYSHLDQVNRSNVADLSLAWFYDVDVRPNVYTAPLAVDGILYFGAGHSVVHALDATTGEELWRYDPQAYFSAGEKMRASWGIRGIGYGDGKVFTGAVDGRLIALDAATGALLWETMTVNPDDGRYISGPPLVYDGTVLIGHGGADFAPVRGYVTAYDVDTGEQLWRFYTVPGNPADGFENAAMEMAAETWTGEWWRYGGGGTVWHAMAYDERFDRVYLGIGNGAPWNQKIRSPGGGDNLFLCSIVALDATTGEYEWHYQVNPGETWDFNAAMDIELADLVIDGEERPVILHAPKNGFFYVIDRESGRVISAETFADTVTWAERIDLQTGRPVENPEARYPDGRAVVVFPSPSGAHAAEAMAYSPEAGLVYIPKIERGRVYVDPPGDLSEWEFTPGQVLNTGTGTASSGLSVPPVTNSLLAWDPLHQRAAWEAPLIGEKAGGVLATAGGLVFQGDVTGQLKAYEALTGETLWSFDAQNGILAQPISYSVGGRQYITVAASWRSGTKWSEGPDWDYVQQRRRILTFALEGEAALPPYEHFERPYLDDAAFVVEEVRAEQGEMVYGRYCFLCHGGGLNAGGTGPDLRKAGSPLDIDTFTMVVRDGLLEPNGMPSFPELADDQLIALQHYIRREARAQNDHENRTAASAATEVQR